MKYLFLAVFIFLQGGDKIMIKNAWIRPAAETFNTAFYCTIVNNGTEPDTLYKASSEISDDVQMHETYKKGDMVGMRPVEKLVIAPDDSLVLKPGGYHIMLMNLKQNAVVNNKKEISLFFKRAGEIKIQAKAHIQQ